MAMATHHRQPVTAKGLVNEGATRRANDNGRLGRGSGVRWLLHRWRSSSSYSTTIGTPRPITTFGVLPRSPLLILLLGFARGFPSSFVDALSVRMTPTPPPPRPPPSKSSGSEKSNKQRIVKSYDLVVIGGGSAGLTAAKFATKFGRTAAIVERDRLGGDCTWTGCVPSKTLLSCAKAVHAVRTSSSSGLFVGSPTKKDPKVDWPSIRERIRSVILDVYDADDSPKVLMEEFGVDTVRGTATFLDPETLLVTGKSGRDDDGGGTGGVAEEVEVRANLGVVVATGATAVRPTDDDVPGLSDVGYITYEEVFDLEDIPPRMTVVGGGPIGCELSQAFSRLGSTVTLVAGGRGLLPGNDAEAGKVLESVFEREGINVVRGRLSGVEPLKTKSRSSGLGVGGHMATCQLGDDTTTTVEGDALLVAVGRRPNISGFGLEGLGASLKRSGKGGIEVDDRLKVVGLGEGNVYAAGDCTGDRQFTHYAGYQGAIAARNILLPLSDPGLLTKEVPGTTFTQPEVSSVGMTEEEAREQYGPDSISVATEYIRETDRGHCEGEEDGFIKIVYHARKFDILGATIVSTSAGEMISELAVASKAGMKLDQLATVMHSYPTYSFALQTMAADVYYDKLARSKGVLNFLKGIGL